MVYHVDQDVEVLWNNSWYPATVLEIGEKKSFLISYDGWSSSYNETIELSKIRLGENKAIDDSCQLKAGDKVEVYWGNLWYKATIEEIKICHTRVSYKNYSQSWDTWIPSDHIRSVKNNSNDISRPIAECVGNLYTNRLFGDVNIHVSSTSFTDLHRCILAARCSRLHKILNNHRNEEDIRIEDISGDLFQLLLEYIYTASAVLTTTEAVSLYKVAASKYQVDGLTEYCLQAIGNACNPDDVLEAYIAYEKEESTLSSKLNDDLEQALLDKMKDNFKSIVESDLFHQLDKNHIISLVQRLASHFEC